MAFKAASVAEVSKLVMDFAPPEGRDDLRRDLKDLGDIGAHFEVEHDEDRDLHAIKLLTFPEALRPSPVWANIIFGFTFCVEGAEAATSMRVKIELRNRETALAYHAHVKGKKHAKI